MKSRKTWHLDCKRLIPTAAEWRFAKYCIVDYLVFDFVYPAFISAVMHTMQGHTGYPDGNLLKIAQVEFYMLDAFLLPINGVNALAVYFYFYYLLKCTFTYYLVYYLWYEGSVGNTIDDSFSYALVANSNDMQAVKLCSNKIFQYLIGDNG